MFSIKDAGSVISGIAFCNNARHRRRSRKTLNRLAEEIEAFKNYLAVREEAIKDTVILILNTSDANGQELQKLSGRFWSKYNLGKSNFVIKSVSREDVRRALASFDGEAAMNLNLSNEFVAIVVDRGVAGVFAI
ncbi:MAG: hypothetical protein WC565_02695 [Parcubacteria group bacterium]